MTYEQLQINDLESLESIPTRSPSSQQDFHVSLTVLQEKVAAIVTSVTCGERLQECSERLDRDGSSVKIRPVYSQERISGIFDGFSTTLPRWGIAWVGEYGELVMSERRIKGSASSLWRTPMATDGECSQRKNKTLAKRWLKKGKTKHLSEQVAYMETFPTPCSSEGWTSRLRSSQQKEGSRHSMTLSNYVERFPTPTVADSKNVGLNGSHQFNLHKYIALFPTPVASGKLNGGTGSYEILDRLKRGGVITEEERRSMSAGNGGKLNPTWGEWLMGFPLEWTDLDASETP